MPKYIIIIKDIDINKFVVGIYSRYGEVQPNI